MGKASRRKSAERSKALLSTTQSKLTALGVNPPVVIRSDLPQAQKISNAISKILESETEPGWPLEEFRHRVNAIVLAWNVSLLPQENQANTLKSLGDFVEKTNPSGAPAAQAELLRLIEKKQAMFPDDKRYIVSYDVQFVGKKVHVTAAAVSAPPPHPATS
jgi:hypothetical protein